VIVAAYSDGLAKEPLSIAGFTVTAYVLNPGDSAAAAVKYSVTAITAVGGVTFKGRFVLTGLSHTTVGEGEIQVRMAGIPKERYRVEWVQPLS